MNSTGWLRSIMAAKMNEEDFLIKVADIIDREFDQKSIAT